MTALVLEACIGYPNAVFVRVAHPVVWIGGCIEALERRWNNPTRSDISRRVLGIVTVLLVAGGAALAGFGVQFAAQRIEHGMLVAAFVATTGLAQRSLWTHVRDVAQPLVSGRLAAARMAVARIVGRDTAQLDESGVAAAALESLAESFNDAVVAPAFWLLIGGLPGLFAYKAINTADSLIGHREPRWRVFGWAAARADDCANLLPARLAGVLLALPSRRGLRVMGRDASKHASPNAGWPEAAMAGALAVRLGGHVTYDGNAYDRPIFGDGRAPDARDLARGLQRYARACALLWLIAATLLLLCSI